MILRKAIGLGKQTIGGTSLRQRIHSRVATDDFERRNLDCKIVIGCRPSTMNKNLIKLSRLLMAAATRPATAQKAAR